MGPELLVTATAVWLGTLFCFAGTVKALAPFHDQRKAVSAYRLLPAGLTAPVARVLPYAEITIGIMLLLTPLTQFAGLMAAGLGLIFALATASVRIRRISTGCGCSGGSSEPVTWLTVSRAIAMTIAGIAVATAGPIEPIVGWTALGASLIPASVVYVRRRRGGQRIASHRIHLDKVVA